MIQMIRLMDKIMRDDNLDLRLTPYSVLATSVNEGFVQFIKAYPLRDVISQHGTIHVCWHWRGNGREGVSVREGIRVRGFDVLELWERGWKTGVFLGREGGLLMKAGTLKP